MIDNIELNRRIAELDCTYSGYFEAENASTINFIEINNGKVTLRAGIVLNEEIWNAIKIALEIEN